MVTFAEWLREERKKRGLTLVQLGQMTGVAIGTLDQCEKGRDIKFSTAIRISEGMGVKLSTIYKRMGY